MAFIRPETISEESVMLMVQSFLLEVAYKMRWWSQWGSPPSGLQFLSSLLKASENWQTSHPERCLACAPLDCSQHIATDFDKSRPECHQHHQQIQLEFQTFDWNTKSLQINCKQILSIMLPLVCYCNKCIEFDGDKVRVNGFKLISDRIFPLKGRECPHFFKWGMNRLFWSTQRFFFLVSF